MRRVGTHVSGVPNTPQNDNNKDLREGCHLRFYCHSECSNGRKPLAGNGNWKQHGGGRRIHALYNSHRSATRSDIAIAGAQMEPPDPSNTETQLTTLDGTDDVTDNSQGTAEVEPSQRMEVTEP